MTQNIFFNPDLLFPSFIQLSHKYVLFCFYTLCIQIRIQIRSKYSSGVHILPCQISLTYQSGSVLIHTPHYRVGDGLRGCGKGEGWGEGKETCLLIRSQDPGVRRRKRYEWMLTQTKQHLPAPTAMQTWLSEILFLTMLKCSPCKAPFVSRWNLGLELRKSQVLLPAGMRGRLSFNSTNGGNGIGLHPKFIVTGL